VDFSALETVLVVLTPPAIDVVAGEQEEAAANPAPGVPVDAQDQ
jgi:hypothetical protein